MSKSHNLSELIDALDAYFSQYRNQLDELYRWKIPADVPCTGFQRGADSLAQANMRLKRALSLDWEQNPSRRTYLATWFVSAWGGVRTNDEETLAAYARASEDELSTRAINGVATWSKILAMRNPSKFQIYDARVSASLNALQIVQKVGNPIIFPSVPSRNTKIVPFQRKLRSLSGNFQKVSPLDAYRQYGEALRGTANRVGLETGEEIEMLLFADAERLVSEASKRAIDPENGL